MAKVIWKDEYNLGIEKVDRQHQHLFEIINKIVDRSGPSEDTELACETIMEMVNYAKEHFTDEEILMQQYDYPNLEAHKKEHNYFNTGTPTPWVKVNYLPEHVFFNHQRHIKKDLACQECHGLIETMDRIKGEQFKMGFCIACHREKKANLDCWTACHN